MNKIFERARNRAMDSYYKPKKKKRMATKKKPKEAVFIKKIVKAVVTKNSVLPILETVNLTGDQLQVTDLETTVILPFNSGVNVCAPYDKFLDVLEIMEAPQFTCDKDFGIHATEEGSKRVVKMMGENPDQFPLSFSKDEYFEMGELGAEELETLARAIHFVSNDDLRPAMTGVLIGEHIAATDAHRLYWKAIINPMMFTGIISRKALKILLDIDKTHWRVFGNGGYEMKDGKIVLKQPTKKVKQQPVCFGIDHGEERGYSYYEGTQTEAEQKFADAPDWQKDTYPTFAAWCDRWLKEVLDPDEEVWVEVPDTEKNPQPVELSTDNLVFINDNGVVLTTRMIDARFPDYKRVIPTDEPRVNLTINPEVLRKELKYAMKFGNVSTKQVAICVNGKIEIKSQDVDFSHEYINDISEMAEAKFTGNKFLYNGMRVLAYGKEGILTDVIRRQVRYNDMDVDEFIEVMSEEDIHPVPELTIAFNGDFLDDIVAKIGCEPIEIKLWSPTKAAIINDSYLLMPLMLNS